MKKLLCVLCMALSLCACDKQNENPQNKPVVKIGMMLPLSIKRMHFRTGDSHETDKRNRSRGGGYKLSLGLVVALVLAKGAVADYIQLQKSDVASAISSFATNMVDTSYGWDSCSLFRHFSIAFISSYGEVSLKFSSILIHSPAISLIGLSCICRR